MRPEEVDQMIQEDETERVEARRKEVEDEPIPEDLRMMIEGDTARQLQTDEIIAAAAAAAAAAAEEELRRNRLLISQLREELSQERQAREAERRRGLKLEEHLKAVQDALLAAPKHRRSPSIEGDKPASKRARDEYSHPRSREDSFPPLPPPRAGPSGPTRDPVRERPRPFILASHNRFDLLYEEAYDGDSADEEPAPPQEQAPLTYEELEQMSDYGDSEDDPNLDTDEEDTEKEKEEKRGRRAAKKQKDANIAQDRENRAKGRLDRRTGRPRDLPLVRRNGRLERSNWFGGALLPEFYYSAPLNAVFTGRTAHMLRNAEIEGRTYSLPVPPRRKRHPAPQGFPMNPQELHHLLEYLNDTFHGEHSYIAWEMYCVLNEFCRLSMCTLSHLRDRAMTGVVNAALFFDPGPAWTHTHRHPAGLSPDSRYLNPSILRNNHPTRGVGIQQPEEFTDVDAWARYIALHGRYGTINPYVGAYMNTQWMVHRGSVRGYLLMRSLQPTVKTTRTLFTRMFASVVGVPGLYRQFLEQHAHNFPNERLSINPRRNLRPIPYSGANLDRWDVVFHMARCGVTYEDADNAYLFASIWRFYHGEGGMNLEFFRELNAEVEAALAARGGFAPPSQDDTWWAPSMEDLERLRVLLEMERTHPEADRQFRAWQHPFLLLPGESPYSPMGGNSFVAVGPLDTRGSTLPAPSPQASTSMVPDPPVDAPAIASSLSGLTLHSTQPEDGEVNELPLQSATNPAGLRMLLQSASNPAGLPVSPPQVASIIEEDVVMQTAPVSASTGISITVEDTPTSPPVTPPYDGPVDSPTPTISHPEMTD